MRVILALAVLILGSTGGEIAITHGMKSTGEPARLRRWRYFNSWGGPCAMGGSGPACR